MSRLTVMRLLEFGWLAGPCFLSCAVLFTVQPPIWEIEMSMWHILGYAAIGFLTLTAIGWSLLELLAHAMSDNQGDNP